MCPVHARIPPAELSGRERTTIPRRPAEGARPSSSGLLRLQRSAGNRAVLDLLSRDTGSSRTGPSWTWNPEEDLGHPERQRR
jgi:hypothetical protein